MGNVEGISVTSEMRSFKIHPRSSHVFHCMVPHHPELPKDLKIFVQHPELLSKEEITYLVNHVAPRLMHQGPRVRLKTIVCFQDIFQVYAHLHELRRIICSTVSEMCNARHGGNGRGTEHERHGSEHAYIVTFPVWNIVDHGHPSARIVHVVEIEKVMNLRDHATLADRSTTDIVDGAARAMKGLAVYMLSMYTKAVLDYVANECGPQVKIAEQLREQVKDESLTLCLNALDELADSVSRMRYHVTQHCTAVRSCLASLRSKSHPYVCIAADDRRCIYIQWHHLNDAVSGSVVWKLFKDDGLDICTSNPGATIMIQCPFEIIDHLPEIERIFEAHKGEYVTITFPLLKTKLDSASRGPEEFARLVYDAALGKLVEVKTVRMHSRSNGLCSKSDACYYRHGHRNVVRQSRHSHESLANTEHAPAADRVTCGDPDFVKFTNTAHSHAQRLVHYMIAYMACFCCKRSGMAGVMFQLKRAMKQRCPCSILVRALSTRANSLAAVDRSLQHAGVIPCIVYECDMRICQYALEWMCAHCCGE